MKRTIWDDITVSAEEAGDGEEGESSSIVCQGDECKLLELDKMIRSMLPRSK